jgi:hypothetical protein
MNRRETLRAAVAWLDPARRRVAANIMVERVVF